MQSDRTVIPANAAKSYKNFVSYPSDLNSSYISLNITVAPEISLNFVLFKK